MLRNEISQGKNGSATGQIVAQGGDTGGKGKPEGWKEKLQGWVRIKLSRQGFTTGLQC